MAVVLAAARAARVVPMVLEAILAGAQFCLLLAALQEQEYQPRLQLLVL
jgi:hypothetical protein